MIKKSKLHLAAISAVTGLLLAFSTKTNPVQAAVYDLNWQGDGGYSLTGSFAFDDQFLGTTVTRNQLSSFQLSFFDPNGSFLQGFDYSFSQFGEFNFNFDTNTGTILQSGFAPTNTGFDLGIDNSSGLEAGLDLYTCFDPSGTCPFLPLSTPFQGIVLQQNDVPTACFDANDPNCKQLDKGGKLTATRKDIPEPSSITALVLLGLSGALIKRKSWQCGKTSA
ncbi:MAG TPA: PEP-CTERM sorting domain-containing protein [Nostocaceae cyanobacterium]|nr:PEP-CTERM sorting domain-containing protein [Nostocaceae cyanobacterium]